MSLYKNDMTRRTVAKQDRALYQIKKFGKDGQPEEIGKLVGFQPPKEREKIEVEFRGETLVTYIAPGQIINPKKEFRRQMKKLGFNPYV